ncbi:hypothetical protein CcrC1_gp387 [Caulobacter phage C1]|nr:hypothetical protein CcrC1_gp387 [Caulobacter phage C1]UTU08616.1 hypothetical protein CcrC2_gp388 [Caulobacter phage C2]UTU09131.1 hypothetical protein CcrJ4_gp382 [Caulobacter phage J4]UTU10249.1 hypothetical protein CcrRB23_gp387 [Caulobacter phage RB23]WGN97283.1 hypothetical protein [Bertelyvirus sp.]
MRLIINAPPALVDDAVEILLTEVKRIEEYNRVGWGWAFGSPPSKFFVRRLKDGLSITHVNKD